MWIVKDTLNPSANGPACVVFDSYNTLTTKAPEQKCRCTQYTTHPDMRLELSMPVPAKDAVLANMNNKQAILKPLGSYVLQKWYENPHVGDEGDAHVIIVQKALEYAQAGFKFIVSANDTGILDLLLNLILNEMDVYMHRGGQDVIPICELQESPGQEICQSLLFARRLWHHICHVRNGQNKGFANTKTDSRMEDAGFHIWRSGCIPFWEKNMSSVCMLVKRNSIIICSWKWRSTIYYQKCSQSYIGNEYQKRVCFHNKDWYLDRILILSYN